MHHQLDGHEFKQAPGDGDGQESLACCSPWGCKELETTEGLNRTEYTRRNVIQLAHSLSHAYHLAISNYWSLFKLMSIESVMPSNHLILCYPLLFLPSIFPSIRVFSNESALRMRWPKYWSFSFSISPSNEHKDGSPLGWTGWISLQSKGLSRVFSNKRIN